MNLVAGVDFETTGFETDKHFVIEIGAALFDAHTWEPVQRFSCFVNEPKALPLPDIIKKVTGITDEDVKSGDPSGPAFKTLHEFLLKAKAVFAHNAPFDQGFFYMEGARAGLEPYDLQIHKWYCSKDDLPHEGKTCKKLSHLALDYGLCVDGSKLHRALDDVILMGRMIKATGLTFEQIKNYAEEPWVYLAMAKGPFNEAHNKEAKEQGYGWEKCYGSSTPVFTKRWVKKIKASRLEEEKQKACSFKREVISATPGTRA